MHHPAPVNMGTVVREIGGPAAPTTFAQDLFAGLGSRYDMLAEVLSFGQNRRWRRAMVDHVVAAAPPLVLDVATGTAGVALQVVRRTGARVVGLDVSQPMIRAGVDAVARRRAQDHVSFVIASADHLPFRDGTFPALTFTYLLRYVPDPAATLAELARVVEAGGTVTSLEFGVPPRRLWRWCWWLYTRLALPVLGGLAGGRSWYRVGRFLGPSISDHYRANPLPQLAQAWRRAGIGEVGTRVMSLGGGVVTWGASRGA